MDYSSEALTRAFRQLGETPRDKIPALIAEAKKTVALPVCEANKRAQARALIVAHGLSQI